MGRPAGPAQPAPQPLASCLGSRRVGRRAQRRRRLSRSSGIATPSAGSSMPSLIESQDSTAIVSQCSRALLVPSSYVELHAASAFSFLQGASLPEALVDRAAELGYPRSRCSIATASTARRAFTRPRTRPGSKPIIGAELTIDGTSEAEVRSQSRRLPTSVSTLCLLPVLCESAEGYQNLCRLITRMKLRAPKGEGALTLEELDGCTRRPRRAGRPRRARRPALRRRRPARSAGRPLRPRAACTSSCSGICRRDEEADNDALVALAAAFRVPIDRDQRRAVRDAGGAAAVRRAHLHPPPHRRSTRPGRRLAPNAERYLKPPARWRALFRRSAGRASRGTRELADRLQYTMADLGYRFPDYPVPPGETQASFLRKITDVGARERYRPYHDQRARADRARARSHREARSRRLLPDRLGHRQFLPAARHPRAGTRVGGQQRRLLQPRHHRGRSGRDGSAVRALSVGGARRVARHRSRSAERRSARAGHPARLREVRPARRGDDRQRHHLSRPQRGARSRQGARLRCRRRSIGSRR